MSPPPCFGPGYGEMPTGMPVSISLLFTAAAIFALVFLGSCITLCVCYYRLAKSSPEVLPHTAKSVLNALAPPPMLPPPEVLRLKAPRTAAIVREDLVSALNKAEELKAELDNIMAQEMAQTGPSGQLMPYGP